MSWALDIALGLAKNGEYESALVWLRRSAQSAAMAESADRAVELAEAAKALNGWIRARKRAQLPVDAPVSKRRASTRTRKISTQQQQAMTPAPSPTTTQLLTVRSAGVRKKPSLPPPARRSSRPPARMATLPPAAPSAAPAKPGVKAAKPKSALPPAKAKSTAPADKPARAKSIAPPAPVAKSKSIAPAKPVAKSKSIAPSAAAKPVAKAKSAVPPAAKPVAKAHSVAPPAGKPAARRPSITPAKTPAPPVVEPASERPPPRRSIGPAAPSPTPRRSMRPPQRTLLFSDVLPAANDPDEPLIADAMRAVPALGSLTKGKRLALAQSAEVVRMAAGDEEAITGMVIVAHGEVRVLSAVSDTAVATMARGDALRGQTSLDIPLALRCVADADGVIVLRWSVVDLAEVLYDAKAAEEALREASDSVHAACGATLGAFAETIGEEAMRELLVRMKLRRLAPGEVWAKANNRMPGICLVGLGELRAGELRDFGPGDVPFAETALANDVLEVELRAGPKGALLWVASNAALFELFTSYPTVLEALSQGAI